jgi:hypothetical protein
VDPPANHELNLKQQRAVAALQKKMAAAPKSHTFVAALEDRDHLRRRRRRAARASSLSTLGQTKCSVTEADIPLAVDFAVGEEGRDPREEEAWFKELPAAQRARLHDVWAQKGEQAKSAAKVHRRNRGRRAGAALIVFAAVGIFGTAAWLVMLAAGLLCALIWSYTGACRYLDPLVALFCFFGVVLTAWVLNGADGAPSASFMDAILLTACATIAGFDAEIRRSGGFGDCR